MKHHCWVTCTAYVLAATWMLSGPAFAAKEKFQRIKPHVNVGTMQTQEPRILLHLMREAANGAANVVPCRVTLLASDITPDSGPRLVIIAEDIEMQPGQSVAVPIPPETSTTQRREVRVEIDAAEDSSSPCPLMISAVGYDQDSEATEYYLDVVGQSRWYKSEVAPNGSPSSGDMGPVFGRTLGFAGGNGDQSLRVVGSTSENTDRENLGLGVHCDFSGTLLIEGVPLLDTEPVNVVQRAYPVRLQQGRVILDSDFSEFGADAITRVDILARYEFNVPLKVGVCADFDLTMQVIDRQTGETAAAKKPFSNNYRRQFY